MPPPLDWLSWEFWAKNSQAIYHLALIVAGAIGIPLLAIRTFAVNRSAKAADAQARTAEQGHITDRFTKAVDQLGSEKMAVRLGAIHALVRISRDSARDRLTIMEILTAYVRERAQLPALANPFVQLQVASDPNDTNGENNSTKEPDLAELMRAKVRPETDIQAVLTVLGRIKEDFALDLGGTDLRGANLWGAHLNCVSLAGACVYRRKLNGRYDRI